MTSQPLKGRKILVTAYDLEQSEHRGIAVYSKSLMRCLHEAGAEVWLLTEFFDKLTEKGLRRLPKSAQAMIHNARILNSLALGRRERPTTALQRKFKLARKAKNLSAYLRLLINILRRPRTYKTRDLNSFSLKSCTTILTCASSALITSSASLASSVHPTSSSNSASRTAAQPTTCSYRFTRI